MRDIDQFCARYGWNRPGFLVGAIESDDGIKGALINPIDRPMDAFVRELVLQQGRATSDFSAVIVVSEVRDVFGMKSDGTLLRGVESLPPDERPSKADRGIARLLVCVVRGGGAVLMLHRKLPDDKPSETVALIESQNEDGFLTEFRCLLEKPQTGKEDVWERAKCRISQTASQQ